MKLILLSSLVLFLNHTHAKDYIIKVSDKETLSHQNELSIKKHLGRDYYLVEANEQSLESLREKKSSWLISYEEDQETQLYSSDPLYSLQWGHQNLGNNEPRRNGGTIPIQGVVGADSNSEKAWKITKGSKKVIVAVIDTGVDYKHEDLKENIWVNTQELNGKKGVDDDNNGYVDDVYGYNFSKNTSDPMDDNKHGTHVAGIIGASHNNVGIKGVMADVKIMSVKYMDKKGRGTLSKAIEAILYAIDNGAKVLNNSWGARKHSQALEEIIQSSLNDGVLFVAAAGNSYSNNDEYPKWPANYKSPNLISVAAYNPEDRLAGFSCYGSESVHLAAPGRNIYSTAPKNKYIVLSGTSMAAPFVSGALGLALSLEKNLTATEIQELIISTSVKVDHLKERVKSGGRLDIYEFLKSITIF